jgi:hypothetical protein
MKLAGSRLQQLCQPHEQRQWWCYSMVVVLIEHRVSLLVRSCERAQAAMRRRRL